MPSATAGPAKATNTAVRPVSPAFEAPARRLSVLGLSFMAIAVGLVTGLGAVLFRDLVSGIHNLAFQGTFSLHYDANYFDPAAPWGAGVILVPVIGGLVVVWLVKRWAPEARGHGIPEVIDSIYFKQGKIRPQVAVVKSLASALSIGTGASVGREGPIVQIGAAIGSSFAQFAGLPTFQRITLLAAGAGAGIAATFNTPLGAVLFTIELMLPEISARALLPVVLATGAATWVGRLAFGLQPAFEAPNLPLPELTPVYVESLAAFLALGAVCGVAAWAFIRTLVAAEKGFQRLPVNDYVRNAVGMTGVGLAMYLLMVNFGQYFIGGTGYATIQAVLNGTMTAAPLLLLLLFAKMMATSVSLAAGASGGVFAPSLFLGTVLGGAFAGGVAVVLPDSGAQVADFAIVGMAAMVAGTTGAAITAIVMVFEMTRDYNVIVPMIVAVAVASGVRQLLLPENIYTVKLLPRGHRIPQERHSNMFMVQPAESVMDRPPVLLPAGTRAAEAAAMLPEKLRDCGVIVIDGDRIVGVVADLAKVSCLAARQPDAPIDWLVSRRFVLARAETVMFDVLKRMGRRRTEAAIVVRPCRGLPRAGDVVGMITKHRIADSVLDSMHTYAD